MPGRGRGAGGGTTVAWGGAGMSRGRGRSTSNPRPSPPSQESDTRQRFAAAHEQMRAAAQKHAQQYQLSDSESEEEVDEGTRDQILGKLCGAVGGRAALGNTSEFVQRALNADASTCLICIGTVKRAEPIWCCAGCYVGFHLACVQKWAQDSISQTLLRLQDGDAQQTDVNWHCPNCRCAYGREEVPSRYTCYCGKVINPALDPWLLPHACDQRCQRALKPDCGHRCLLQCHPGPCPPCPVTVKTRCYCGNSGPDARRCGNKHWACQKSCNKLLNCGTHRCSQPCHAGACPECPKTSVQQCLCGRNKQLRPCATPDWQCDQVCDAPLACGRHRCAALCHAGPCGGCARAGRRSCPCGRTQAQLPCDQEVPPCGDTCDKLLLCGVHRCTSRCHTGNCGRCLQLRLKRCRCGRKEKEMVCDKEFTCEVKCKRLKQCGIHTCNRKCCTGDCPPCEQTCGRTLPCRTHKCASPCHTGPCYPCPLTVELACPCGLSRLTLPCGRQRLTRPPRCRQPCQRPPDCHHQRRQRHLCHAGACPPCTQVCDRRLDCGREHRCAEKCHDRVEKRLVRQRAATPWEQQQDQVLMVTLPCPPCQAPVSMLCLGGHAEYPQPCERARRESCGRPCGRQLSCGNHTCRQACHTVQAPPDDQQAGETCDVCQLRCTKPRPEGCTHPCPRGCHADPCPPCRDHRRLRCHCQISLLHVRCYELTEAGSDASSALLSCGNTCPKSLPCGHRCTLDCHPGECTPPEGGCPTRVKLRCACGRRAQPAICRDLREAGVDALKLECDQECRDKLEAQEKERAARGAAAAEEEAAKRRAEVEALERKLAGRRRERKRRRTNTEEAGGSRVGWKVGVGAGVVVVLAMLVYLMMQ